MTKTFFFIDGSNLYNAQYELFGPTKYLHFSSFIKAIEKLLKFSFDKIFFYASYSPRSKHPTTLEKNYLKNESLFYQSVKQTQNTVFFKGYRSLSSGKEKEVDVKLAVDLVDFAHRRKYSQAFLLSGDADFMQALYKIKKLHIPVSVLCMNNKIMYKALLFYKTFVIRFNRKIVRLKKIRRKPDYLTLDKRVIRKV